MRGYLRMWTKDNFADEMKNISTPVLAVFGKYDNENLTLDALMPKFSNWFSNIKVMEVESGHYPMQEVPVEYACEIQKVSPWRHRKLSII